MVKKIIVDLACYRNKHVGRTVGDIIFPENNYFPCQLLRLPTK